MTMTAAQAIKAGKNHFISQLHRIHRDMVRSRDIVVRNVHRADSITTGPAWIVSLMTVDCTVSAILSVTFDGEVVDLS